MNVSDYESDQFCAEDLGIAVQKKKNLDRVTLIYDKMDMTRAALSSANPVQEARRTAHKAIVATSVSLDPSCAPNKTCEGY